MLAWNGQAGVQIFFAISRLLITTTSIRRWKDLFAVRARLLRLRPAGATVAGWDSHPLEDRAFARRTA
jgi:peptidoglycan/LPS O-acetylase OafA/YrhL